MEPPHYLSCCLQPVSAALVGQGLFWGYGHAGNKNGAGRWRMGWACVMTVLFLYEVVVFSALFFFFAYLFGCNMDFNKEEGKTVFESGFQFKFFV